jgi:hypothetical protein
MAKKRKKMHPAKITTLSGKKLEISALFNPTEYQVSESNQFAEVSIPGVDAPPLQFVRGAVRTLSMQLFFDTYDPVGENSRGGSKPADVREETNQVVKLLKVDPHTHAPPVCQFSWAKFSFVGVLEKADQKFTLFWKDGTPVRATVDVTFKELGQHKPDPATNRFSSDFTKRHVVRRGDTLSNIAAEQYGDPGAWRPIAEANGLDDPLALQAGQMLVIPARP